MRARALRTGTPFRDPILALSAVLVPSRPTSYASHLYSSTLEKDLQLVGKMLMDLNFLKACGDFSVGSSWTSTGLQKSSPA